MAYKTMLRQLISKWGIMSIDMQQAIAQDLTLNRDDGSIDYLEAEPAAPAALPVQGEPVPAAAPQEAAQQALSLDDIV